MSHENKCPKCGKGSVPMYGGQFHVCSTFVRMDGSGGGGGTEAGGIDGLNQASEVGDEEAATIYAYGSYPAPEDNISQFDCQRRVDFFEGIQYGRLSAKKLILEECCHICKKAINEKI